LRDRDRLGPHHAGQDCGLSPRASWRSHLLVAIQLAGVLGCIYPFDPGAHGPVYLLVMSVAGMALGATTLWHNRIGNFGIYPEPRPRTTLVTSGPYRLVRHPMYAALLLVTAGAALYNRGLLNFIALALVTAAVVAKARLEERYLGRRFPEYAAYRARTRRFVPLLW